MTPKAQSFFFVLFVLGLVLISAVLVGSGESSKLTNDQNFRIALIGLTLTAIGGFAAHLTIAPYPKIGEIVEIVKYGTEDAGKTQKAVIRWTRNNCWLSTTIGGQQFVNPLVLRTYVLLHNGCFMMIEKSKDTIANQAIEHPA